MEGNGVSKGIERNGSAFNLSGVSLLQEFLSDGSLSGSGVTDEENRLETVDVDVQHVLKLCGVQSLDVDLTEG